MSDRYLVTYSDGTKDLTEIRTGATIAWLEQCGRTVKKIHGAARDLSQRDDAPFYPCGDRTQGSTHGTPSDHRELNG